jgi:signal transduction histidine kinase
MIIAYSGKVISQDELPHFFEQYYKSENSSKSTGLGLGIVKKIMELHQTCITNF